MFGSPPRPRARHRDSGRNFVDNRCDLFRGSNRDLFRGSNRELFLPNLHRASQRLRSESPATSQLYSNGNRRSESPKPSHMFGHPVFRTSNARRTTHPHVQQREKTQRDLWRAASQRELSRLDPVRSSRKRMSEGTKSREILATISPRKLPSCHRCVPPGAFTDFHWNRDFHNCAFHY